MSHINTQDLKYSPYYTIRVVLLNKESLKCELCDQITWPGHAIAQNRGKENMLEQVLPLPLKIEVYSFAFKK